MGKQVKVSEATISLDPLRERSCEHGQMVAVNLTPASKAGVAETNVSDSPHCLGGGEAAGVLPQQQAVAAEAAMLPGPGKTPPSMRETLMSALRKGIEKFGEKSGEVLAILFWSALTIWCLLTALGVQFSLETLKGIKEAFPLY